MFPAMNVKSHFVAIAKNGITNTICVDRATPLLTKDHLKKSIPPRLHSSVQTTAPRNTDLECNEHLEYKVDKVVDHHHTSKYLIYRVRWYKYTPEVDTWEAESQAPRHFVTRYWNWHSKKGGACRLTT